MMEERNILEVRGLTRTFAQRGGEPLRAVDSVSFSVERGEIFGLVGESGSGKSTVARCIAGLELPDSGVIAFSGGKRAIILQDAPSSMNPRMTVFDIVAEPLDAARGYRRALREFAVAEAMRESGLDEGFNARYPSELSGGEAQRAAIARAIVTKPELIILDEPLAALDVTLGAQLVKLFLRLCRERGTSFLLISHDLSMARRICAHIGVMRAGRMVEQADTRALCENPKQEYTKMMLASILLPDPGLYKA